MSVQASLTNIRSFNAVHLWCYVYDLLLRIRTEEVDAYDFLDKTYEGVDAYDFLKTEEQKNKRYTLYVQMHVQVNLTYLFPFQCLHLRC